MAARKNPPPHAVPQVQTPAVDDAKTQRALAVLTSAVQQIQATNAAAGGKVTGSRASGAALASLLAVLASQGIITDDTEA